MSEIHEAKVLRRAKELCEQDGMAWSRTLSHHCENTAESGYHPSYSTRLAVANIWCVHESNCLPSLTLRTSLRRDRAPVGALSDILSACQRNSSSR